MKFKFNLIRELQKEQHAAESLRTKVMGVSLLCFGMLAVALFYCVLQVFAMRNLVAQEKMRLDSIKAEYQQYKASKMIVTKSDVDLLDRLQRNRIFWTKKLLIMARHLPTNFWITQFEYDTQALTVDGYGYITNKQRQLITLHKYLDGLRKERNFRDVFNPVHLNLTQRSDDKYKRARVSFSYSGVGRKP